MRTLAANTLPSDSLNGFPNSARPSDAGPNYREVHNTKPAGNDSRPVFCTQQALVAIAASVLFGQKTVSPHNGINPFRKKIACALMGRFALGNRRNSRTVNEGYDETRGYILQAHSFYYPADCSIKTNTTGTVSFRYRARLGGSEQLHVMRRSRSRIRRHAGR